MAIISGEICLQLPRLSPLRAKRRLKWLQMMVEWVFRVAIWSRGQRSWISQSCLRFFDSSYYDVECVCFKKLLNSLAPEFSDFNFASSFVCGLNWARSYIWELTRLVGGAVVVFQSPCVLEGGLMVRDQSEINSKMEVWISCATLPLLWSMVQIASDDLSRFVWNFFLQWHTYKLLFFTLWWIIWSAYPSLGLEYGNKLENDISVCNHCHIANLSLVFIYVDSNVEEDLDDMIVLPGPWKWGL